MNPKRALAVVLLAGALAGCGAGSSPDPAVPEPAGEEISLTGVVDQANDVNRQLEQRYSDMESMIP